MKGDREGQFSIRINDQWRICFEWPDGDDGPSNVEITDYHEVETLVRTPIQPGGILADELGRRRESSVLSSISSIIGYGGCYGINEKNHHYVVASAARPTDSACQATRRGRRAIGR